MTPVGRTDRWALGSGRGHLFWPGFPAHLTAPGFWEEVSLGDGLVPRLFTVFPVDERGRLRLTRGTYLGQYSAAQLVFRHETDGFSFLERRTITPDGAFCSVLFAEGAPDGWSWLQWSVLPRDASGIGNPWRSLRVVERVEDAWLAALDTAWPADVVSVRDGVREAQMTSDRMHPARRLFLAWGGGALRDASAGLTQLHPTAPHPDLVYRPAHPSDLPDETGLVHLTRRVAMEPRTVLAAGLSADPRRALGAVSREALRDPVSEAERGVARWVGGWPEYDHEDPFFTAAYRARVEGLRLNLVNEEGLGYAGPFVTEGPGFFRNLCPYSSQAILRELSWRLDPSEAIGVLDNLVAAQREDGSLPGHIYGERPARDFYHADLATGMRRLHRHHPLALTKDHLGMLRRYADWLTRDRALSPDPAGPTLYRVRDQNETGQEYMNRYLGAREHADDWGEIRLGGVDATVYALKIFDFLAEMRPADSVYRAYADGARRGLRELSYDPESRIFCDVLADGSRSGARPATGFYAYLDAETGAGRESDFARWFGPGEPFDTPYGIPAEATTEPTYSAEGLWRGRRMNCPWSGRSWPMANSHIVDAAFTAGSPLAPELLRRAIHLLFKDGDPTRPCVTEHYDPVTGRPSLYRGIEDYMHSWVIDLLLRHAPPS